ncbi:MAG: ATP phosphoribosyltransferase [Deferribacteraceae bacterium]|nr:ATP phosphoribosyltransferase [Deferribacteraceae bacterium]
MQHKQLLSFALPKGRLAEETVKLFIERGICSSGVVDFSSRKLIFEDEAANMRFLIVRNSDVPTYVERGAADFGVVGKDVLEETGLPLYEFYDFGFGKCRMSVAAPKSTHTHYWHNMRIATKYPAIAKRHFAGLGIFIEVIKLYGSIEIAPLTGLADYIVDLVESGETMRKNGLEEVEVIMQASARLVANQSLVRAKHERVKAVLAMLEQGK